MAFLDVFKCCSYQFGFVSLNLELQTIQNNKTKGNYSFEHQSASLLPEGILIRKRANFV